MVSRSFLCRKLRVRIPGVKAFNFDGGSCDDFINRVRGVLADHGLSDYVNLHRDGDELVVGFRWMGSSELRYIVTEKEAGFRAEPSGERLSPFHAPFRQRFDDRFEKVIGEVGATIG